MILIKLFHLLLKVTHQQRNCCAAAVAGINDEDYVDAGFQFPIVETAGTNAPVQLTTATVSKLSTFGLNVGDVESKRKASEHYDEFYDLFGEATNVC